MPSNKLRNKELEFTPTFGSQHYWEGLQDVKLKRFLEFY
jgi:hypothetical protein